MEEKEDVKNSAPQRKEDLPTLLEDEVITEEKSFSGRPERSCFIFYSFYRPLESMGLEGWVH